MLCLINRQASSSARALGQAHTGGAGIAWEEPARSFWMSQSLTPFPVLGMALSHAADRAAPWATGQRQQTRCHRL